METISREQAAAVAAGNDSMLLGCPPVLDTRAGTDPSEATLSVIRRLGGVQIDTISVVNRAHNHIVWSRNRRFTERDFAALQAGPRRIFEYWTHAAAYLPIEDYRFCLPRMERIRRHGFEWYQRNRAVMEGVLSRIRSEGEVSARDFEDDRERPGGVWWDWKPAKIALEHLFMEGSIMVVRRDGFQKVYDLTERVLPAGTDTTSPSPEESADYLIGRAIGSLGIVSLQEITYLRRDGVSAVPGRLAELAERGTVIRVGVEGTKRPYYTLPRLLADDANAPGHGASAPEPAARILSPFDPLVLSRRRLRELFGYSYTLECFLPQEKRKFGYFALPILYGSRIAGIMDAKADRKRGKLLVKAIGMEPFVDRADGFSAAFESELREFARFNGCAETEFSAEAARSLEVSPGH